MSFPVIDGTNKGNTVANATSSTINLPATITSGDRLLALVVVDQNTGSAFTGWPAGWIEVFVADGATSLRAECRYKEATGSEGASFSLGHALNMSCHMTWKYQAGTFQPATAPEASVSTGTSATPDPPGLSHSWGIGDTHSLAVCAYDDGTRTLTTPAPTNYTVVDNSRGPNAQSTGCGVARWNTSGGLFNPSTFTISISQPWIAATIALRPAAPTHLELIMSFTYRTGQSVDVSAIVDDGSDDILGIFVYVFGATRDVPLFVYVGNNAGLQKNITITTSSSIGDYATTTLDAPIPRAELWMSCQVA